MDILILGANSDIALAIARELGRPGDRLQLVSRNESELQKNARDIELRTEAIVRFSALDLVDVEDQQRLLSSLDEAPDVVIFALGYLGDQQSAQTDDAEARRILDTNFTAAVIIGERLAAAMEARGSGVIVGIASVAGLRGRQSNYIYGAAKAGMIAWLSGLRNRLFANGVHVLTVLPGFVATKMTAKLDLPPALTAKPEAVAAAVAKAINKRRNVIFVKPVWRWIMLVIRTIPESVFKRLKL